MFLWNRNTFLVLCAKRSSICSLLWQTYCKRWLIGFIVVGWWGPTDYLSLSELTSALDWRAEIALVELAGNQVNICRPRKEKWLTERRGESIEFMFYAREFISFTWKREYIDMYILSNMHLSCLTCNSSRILSCRPWMVIMVGVGRIQSPAGSSSATFGMWSVLACGGRLSSLCWVAEHPNKDMQELLKEMLKYPTQRRDIHVLTLWFYTLL